MKSININECVTVQLTAYGKEVLSNYVAGWADSIEDYFGPKYNGKTGEFTEQLYELMHIFGPTLRVGTTIPFKNNEIFINKDKLH